jgi:hypothetical protein
MACPGSLQRRPVGIIAEHPQDPEHGIGGSGRKLVRDTSLQPSKHRTVA